MTVIVLFQFLLRSDLSKTELWAWHKLFGSDFQLFFGTIVGVFVIYYLYDKSSI